LADRVAVPAHLEDHLLARLVVLFGLDWLLVLLLDGTLLLFEVVQVTCSVREVL